MASSGGRRSERSRCLLCEGQMRRSDNCSLRHIQKHLNYIRYACQQCTYRCSTEDASMVHEWKSGHRVVPRENEYLEMLASKIFVDCLHASSFGIEPVLSAMRAECFNRPRNAGLTVSVKEEQKGGSDDVVEINATEKNTSNSRHSAQRRKDEELRNEGEVSERERDVHIHESTQIMIDTAEQPPTKKKTGNTEGGNSEPAGSGVTTALADSTRTEEVTNSIPIKRKKKRRSSVETAVTTEQTSQLQLTDAAQRTAETVGEAEVSTRLRSETTKKIRCHECGKNVKSDYVHRRRHVTMHHHRDVADKDFSEVLSSEIRECFPGCIVYSDTQCNECGKEYKSESGRKYHAIRSHMQRMMNCVIHGCCVREHSPADLKFHIQNDHGIAISNELNADVFRVFLCAKKKFDAALAAEVLRCFPMNLRSRSMNPLMPSTVTERTGNAVSSSADTMESTTVDSLKNARERVLSSSQKRHESSSSSSSDEDSDSQRYAEAMRNRGRSDITDASPNPVDDESAWSLRTVSRPNKAAPSDAQKSSQIPSLTTVPSQSRILKSATTSSLNQLHVPSSTSARPQSPAPVLSTTVASTPSAHPHFQKRKTLLELNATSQQQFKQEPCVAAAGLNGSTSSRHDLFPPGTTSDLANPSNNPQWLSTRNVPMDHSLSLLAGYAGNCPEQHKDQALDRSSSQAIYDSSAFDRQRSDGWHISSASAPIKCDRRETLKRTFPAKSKKQSHRIGHVTGRSRSSKYGKSKVLPKRAKAISDENKRRESLGGLVRSLPSDRSLKKPSSSQRLCSSKKKGKSAKKRAVPSAIITSASNNIMEQTGTVSGRTPSHQVPKRSGRGWTGKRKRLDWDEFKREEQETVENKSNQREWYIKEEF